MLGQCMRSYSVPAVELWKTAAAIGWRTASATETDERRAVGAVYCAPFW